MLTDLVQIKLLGEKKRPENERFRKHMKSFDHSDRILRRIAEGIEDSIDCLEFANCCRVATAKVTERDVERLAKYLHVKPARVMADYVAKSEEEGLILQRDQQTPRSHSRISERSGSAPATSSRRSSISSLTLAATLFFHATACPAT